MTEICSGVKIRGKEVKEMYITRECDYAVRVVRALSDGNRASVNEICEKECITAPFAYKILKKLQKEGIVKGFRGVHGGYTIKRSLEELSLYEVYHAINPNMFIIECLEKGYECSRGEECAECKIHGVLQQVQDRMVELLKEQKMDKLV